MPGHGLGRDAGEIAGGEAAPQGKLNEKIETVEQEKNALAEERAASPCVNPDWIEARWRGGR